MEDKVVKTSYLREKRDVSENMYAAHNRALVALAEKDRRIVSCYADFPPGEVGQVFSKKFPDRLIDVGIAEGHLITCAAGLADAGFIPFTHCHALFALGRGYNQIRHNLAYDNRNVKVVLCNSGVIWGEIGPSHLAIEDIAALRAVPNLVFLSPSDSVTSEKATVAAAEHVGPVILRLPAVGASYPTIYATDLKFEIGKAISLHEGDDVAILATGILVHDALVVAEGLLKDGIQGTGARYPHDQTSGRRGCSIGCTGDGRPRDRRRRKHPGWAGRSRCGIDLREMSCFHQEGRGQRPVRRIG